MSFCGESTCSTINESRAPVSVNSINCKFSMRLHRCLLNKTMSSVLKNWIGCFEIKRNVMVFFLWIGTFDKKIKKKLKIIKIIGGTIFFLVIAFLRKDLKNNQK